MLKIDKSSWHFRYYCALRNLWGSSIPDRTSLCLYCQSLFWFSVASIFLSPVFAIGWLFIKFCRGVYKFLDRRGFNSIVGWIEDKFSNELDSCETLEENAFMKCLISGMASLFLVFMGLLGLGLVFKGTSFIFGIIPLIPGCIWIALLYVGWFFFEVFAVIGRIESWIWFAVSWLFTNGELWGAIWFWFSRSIALCVCAFVASMAFWLLSRIKLFRTIGDFLVLKYNGFVGARAEVKEKKKQLREEEKEAERRRLISVGLSQKKEATKPVCVRAFLSVLLFVRDLFVCIARWVKHLFVNRGDGKGNEVLSPAMVFFTFLWAIKKGVCPLVEFVAGDEVVDKEKPEESEEIKEIKGIKELLDSNDFGPDQEPEE